MSDWHNFTTDCQSFTHRGDIGDDNRTFTCGLMEIAAFGVVAHVVEDTPEGLALEVRAIGIGHKIEVHLRLFEEYLLDAELLAADTQGYDTDEFFSDVGDGSETVSEAAAIGFEVIVEVLAGGKVVEFTVEQHTL